MFHPGFGRLRSLQMGPPENTPSAALGIHRLCNATAPLAELRAVSPCATRSRNESGVDTQGIAGAVSGWAHQPNTEETMIEHTNAEQGHGVAPAELTDGGDVAALREIAAGQHIGDHTRRAQEVLASRAGDGDPIYIRPDWEIGGEWFEWTRDAQQDLGPVEQFYPGDNAVDVISTDIYWNPQWMGADPRHAFAWSTTLSDDYPAGAQVLKDFFLL